ncbi:TetR/AcrR family transcriptional regulator [Nocardia vulneris]|uniref:TetR/AcrR family transcriptional regulator n=1 Tax=Nocardia vulneris TaxID=1141657 RepID=UPI0030D544DA
MSVDGVRKRPQQARSVVTVEFVLEAAAQLFDRRGIAATTNEISARAGVSIGTLYQYFPNKYALVHALAQRHVRDAAGRLGVVFAQLRAERPPFDRSMRAVLDVVVAAHREHPGLHRLMHRLAPRAATDLVALQEFEAHAIGEIAFHLHRCGRGGADPALTAAMLFHAVDAHLHRVLLWQSIDVDQLMELVERLAPLDVP